MRPAESSRWDFRHDDQLKTQTLLEWGVGCLPPCHVVMRVGYAAVEEEWETYQRTDRVPHQIQVVMSPTAAKELAAQLGIYADLSELPPGSLQNVDDAC